MRPFQIRALATVAVAAFALAACGSSSKSSASSDTTSPPTSAEASTTTTLVARPASVKVATTKLGKVLVDSNGMTLYRFDNDTTPGKSTCTTGVCASTWPAATVAGAATPGPGVEAAKLTTFALPDGKMQLQMDGHPLYRFAGDAKAGDTHGQGILNKWYAVAPDGDKVGDAT